MGGNQDPRIGTLLASRYRLRRKLGAGGMGVVFLAEQEPLGRDVVVKLMKSRNDETDARRFAKEAALVSRLSHPHIVSVFDYGRTEEGELYLAMEHLRGRVLKEICDEKKPRPTWAKDIVLQIAHALDAAHEQGIAHRDLTPNNVFLVQEARLNDFVKVLDFGLAKQVAGDDVSLSLSGEMLGTPAYMSPEQYEGESADMRSDMYALGVIWYELVTGGNPFRAETPVQSLVRHSEVDAVPPKDLGFELEESHERILMRLLSKEPAIRPSARQLIETLEGISADVSATRPIDEAERARHQRSLIRRSRQIRNFAFAASLVAAVVLISAVASVSRPAESGRWTAPEVKPLIAPLIAYPGLDKRQIALGKALYHAGALSEAGSAVSCATCHPVEAHGTTHESRTRLGVGAQREDPALPDYNTPSCVVAALQYKQQWQARKDSLEELVDVPLFNPILMNGGNWDEVGARVRADAHLMEFFAGAKTEPDPDTMRFAIATYLRSIIPLDNALDRYLRKEGELSVDAADGLNRFQELGCVSCHQGRALGGTMLARFGVMTDSPYADRGVCELDRETRCRSDRSCAEHSLGTCVDQGISLPGDKGADGLMRFKVPSLRNVVHTAPYFHDGSAHDLEEAIRTMAKLQLGTELTEWDVRVLTAFLRAAAAGDPPL